MTGVCSPYNLQLIEAYMACPQLYDLDHPEYKVPHPTMKAWQSVGEKCGASQTDCRIRWKALRDRYIKERKRVHQADPLSEYNRKSWPLYDKMDFLDPYVEKQRKRFPKICKTPKNDIGGIKSEPGEDESVDYSDDGLEHRTEFFSSNLQLLKACEGFSGDTLNDGPSNTDHDENSSIQNGVTSQSIPISVFPSISNNLNSHNGLTKSITSSNKKKRKYNEIEESEPAGRESQMDNILQCLRSCADALLNMSQSVSSENEDTLFGRYVSTVLQSMSVEERNLRKQKIFAALHGDLEELGGESNKSVHDTSNGTC
ncbi:alcohol dehydrogenase transcription factor myb/SANT-like domain-containing protein [Ditylenchus destructor]|nr:alcohol dehydrogenase transcription factor myb/SANT-like domain-containing protein [Ditylenchus destructor]